MRIIQGTTEFKLEKKSAVAMGKFDGIHLGHRKLVEKILEYKKNGILAVIFTFNPSPEAFFTGKDLKGLMSAEEKRLAFENMGIDVLIEFPLNKETAAIEAGDFVSGYLGDRLNAAFIVAGTDISFGNRGEGDAALLKRMSETCGYQVDIIDKVTYKGREISSTFIRETLNSGDMESVAALMGAPYRINGAVSHGRELGRRLGMPTANLLPSAQKLLPPAGVYYSYVWMEQTKYCAISNVGCRPTVTDDKVMALESYLYNFDKVIYGKDIMVELLHWKRPEMKFGSVEELKAQMQKDIREGAAFHNPV